MIYTDQSSDQRDVQTATCRVAHTDQPLDGREGSGGCYRYFAAFEM